ncbi:FAD:protein FMN transferase [Coralliovum pocilloporae]|uniref:FAD:protein FMN transferase n=1 Tax=Coralliovum pocilloporae TaxID=3066369 RepID=UPI0033078BF6
MNQPTRRRFLTITAGFTSAMAGPGLASAREDRSLYSWQGSSLGAEASLQFAHRDEAKARAALKACRAELERLENVFSLYRGESQVSRLNRQGFLDAPDLDLVRLLGLSRTLWQMTGGRFDPTVQSDWKALAEGYQAETDRVHDLSMVSVAPDRVTFAKPRMSITLNGIAQGCITDRITELLSRFGYTDTLVDMGEIRASGHHPDGSDWRVGLAPDNETDKKTGRIIGNRTVRRVSLKDEALATSAPLGTLIDAEKGIGHILVPGQGWQTLPQTQVSLTAPSAALADGLSTACCLMNDDQIQALIRTIPGVRRIA